MSMKVGIHLNKNHLVPVKPGMIHPGTTAHAETRGRCDIMMYIFIVCIYIYLFGKVESQQNMSCVGQKVRTKEQECE